MFGSSDVQVVLICACLQVLLASTCAATVRCCCEYLPVPRDVAADPVGPVSTRPLFNI